MSNQAILCVNAEARILERLQGQLQSDLGSNYPVEVARSDEEALILLEELTRQHIEVPIIISNHIMPDMSEQELLGRRQEDFPETLKVFLTGSGGADVLRSAHPRRCIFEPWEREDLNIIDLSTRQPESKDHHNHGKMGHGIYRSGETGQMMLRVRAH